MTTELLDAVKHQVAAFTPFYAQLAELKDNNTALTFDYESTKGNKEARSHIFKLRQSKAALEKARKEEKEESLNYGKKVDAEAKVIAAEIEGMINVHQVKIDEIEEREKDRIAAITRDIEQIKTWGEGLNTSSALQVSLTNLGSIAIDNSFAEYSTQAAQLKDARLVKLRGLLDETLKAEAEAAELTRLREEAAARAQKDRDDAIAKAAADKAKREAEELAARKEAQAKKAIADAEAKAKAESEAATRRELELKLQAENAERRVLEERQRAIEEAAAAEARAKAEQAAAVKREQDRAAAAKKSEEDAAAKREANKKHRAKINNAAVAAFVAGGMTEETAKLAVTLIAQGIVPAISISY
ncbi:MAG: hypothetical protein V4447_10535 [Pseudomonadota bacterium]